MIQNVERVPIDQEKSSVDGRRASEKEKDRRWRLFCPACIFSLACTPPLQAWYDHSAVYPSLYRNWLEAEGYSLGVGLTGVTWPLGWRLHGRSESTTSHVESKFSNLKNLHTRMQDEICGPVGRWVLLASYCGVGGKGLREEFSSPT